MVSSNQVSTAADAFELDVLKAWIFARLRDLDLFTQGELGDAPTLQWQAISGDAGFRHYWRVSLSQPVSDLTEHKSFIACFAPPDTEKTAEFVAVSNLLNAQGVSAAKVFAVDLQKGFVFLEDLGSQELQPLLSPEAFESWYEQALAQLVAMAGVDCDAIDSAQALAPYSPQLLMQEMQLFVDWFVSDLLGLSMSEAVQSQFSALFDCLIESAISQQQVFVHRDYHGRNIMVAGGSEAVLSVIDFQDAVKGPLTYDAVSLLKDCYVKWPRENVLALLERYHAQLIAANICVAPDFADFTCAFDFMGLQRHIKVLGIFARLSIRDNKHGYLADLPRVFNYVLDALEVYRVQPQYAVIFEPIYQYFVTELLPCCQEKLDGDWVFDKGVVQ